MTKDHIRQLHAEWVTASSIPPDLDLRSRKIRERAQQIAGVWDIMNCPDFGWSMAWKLASSGLTCASLNEPPYGWIRKGVERIETLGKDPSQDPLVHTVTEAMALCESANMHRPLIQAALLARDATEDKVAAALGLTVPVVDAYSTLFFDVLDRKDDAAYRQHAMRVALTPRGCVYDVNHVSLPGMSLLLTGLGGTVSDVMTTASRIG